MNIDLVHLCHSSYCVQFSVLRLLSEDVNNIFFSFFSYDSGLGVRVFSSAEISKRHTATVLETADGIMVTVTGFLDRSRTHQNGFPPEVCNSLLCAYVLQLDLRKLSLNPKCKGIDKDRKWPIITRYCH